MKKFVFILIGIFTSALMASGADARGEGKTRPPTKHVSKVESKKVTKVQKPLSQKEKKQKEYDDAMINGAIMSQIGSF